MRTNHQRLASRVLWACMLSACLGVAVGYAGGVVWGETLPLGATLLLGASVAVGVFALARAAVAPW